MTPLIEAEITDMINTAIDTDGRFLLRLRPTTFGPDKWDFTWVVHTSSSSAHLYTCWWYDQPGELGYDKFRMWLAVQMCPSGPMTYYRTCILWTWFRGIVEGRHAEAKDRD